MMVWEDDHNDRRTKDASEECLRDPHYTEYMDVHIKETKKVLAIVTE